MRETSEKTKPAREMLGILEKKKITRMANLRENKSFEDDEFEKEKRRENGNRAYKQHGQRQKPCEKKKRARRASQREEEPHQKRKPQSR